MPDHTQVWVAELRYADREKPFWFGDVHCRVKAPQHEVEAEIRAQALQHIPEDFEILQTVPGHITLHFD